MRILAFLMCIWLFTGCKKDDPLSRLAYYQFTPAEYARIPKYKQGDTLIYTNQSGDTVALKVTLADVRLKTRLGDIGFFGPTEYYYYDLIKYTLTPLPIKTDPPFTAESFPINYLFLKEPLNEDSAKINQNKLFPARFHGQVQYPRWNAMGNQNYRDTYIRLPYVAGINTNATLKDTSLQIQNTFYPEVSKIQAVSKDTARHDWDVHTLYYAFQHGIIGFDDVLGNQWRLHKH